MEQWHSGGPQRVLLQQLDDPAIPAAPAAVHPAQLLPVPEVSEVLSVSEDVVIGPGQCPKAVLKKLGLSFSQQ